MFGNRFYTFKAMTALVAILAGCFLCHHWGREINPPFWRCRLQPSRFQGRHLWIPSAVVRQVEKDLFIVDENGDRIPVRGRSININPADTVQVTGWFDGTTGTLLLDRVKPWPSHGASRRSMEMISIGVLIVVSFLFFRRFRIRTEVWHER